MQLRRFKKSRNIQSILLLTYFVALAVVFLFFLIYLIFIKSGELKKESYDTLTRNLTSEASYLDSEISTLSTVAENVAYSALVRDRFSQYLSGNVILDKDLFSTEDRQSIEYSLLQSNKVLIDMLTAIIGPRQPVSQIYIHNDDRGRMGTGHFTFFDVASQSVDQAWYSSLMENGQKKYMYSGKDEILSNYYTNPQKPVFLSYCIPFYNKHNQLQGIIEVKNPLYQFTFDIQTIGNLYGESLFIYNNNGECLYRADAEGKNKSSFIINTATQNSKSDFIYNKVINSDDFIEKGVVHIIDGENGTTLFYLCSAETECLSVFCVSNSQITKNAMQYVSLIVLTFLTFAGTTFLISFAVARYITSPIRKIMQKISHFSEKMDEDISSLNQLENTRITEFDTLYSSLLDTRKKMRISMQNEITLHNQEIQSRMLALQSQMNPHFLYNSLATIQSMADEDMYREIMEMCQNMSRILRYISSDQQLLVSVRDDVSHMCDYLNCMKMRYLDDFDYEIQIPDEMWDIQIPKLCLQMIAENSIKYASKSTKPPWYITIVGTLQNKSWEICIKDNGVGFSDESIETLNQKMDEINQTDDLPSLEINGMGLLNIYIRLKLLYKNKHYMKIGNTIYGGAMVTIGGVIDE